VPEARNPSQTRKDSSSADSRRLKVRCQAVFLDGGGVIVLPNGDLVRAALKRLGIEIDPSLVAPAHYRAVRQIDRGSVDGAPIAYLGAFCRALGVQASRLEDTVEALLDLADRGRSGEILWSRPAPHAIATIEGLRSVGLPVFVVTNSDGHAAENLRDAGVCDTTAGQGAVVADVVDSGRVGSEKPDTGIFRVALERAGVEPTAVVHVGDMVSTDVTGARAAGIVPIHLDPTRRCRARDHRHVRALNGVWRHVAPWDGSGAPASR
jgi:phosphoglycolate phosphatase-like HAD superfamily hydrolase